MWKDEVSTNRALWHLKVLHHIRRFANIFKGNAVLQYKHRARGQMEAGSKFTNLQIYRIERLLCHLILKMT